MNRWDKFWRWWAWDGGCLGVCFLLILALALAAHIYDNIRYGG